MVILIGVVKQSVKVYAPLVFCGGSGLKRRTHYVVPPMFLLRFRTSVKRFRGKKTDFCFK